MRNKRILPYKIMNDKLMFCLFKMRCVAKNVLNDVVLQYCCGALVAFVSTEEGNHRRSYFLYRQLC